MKNGIIIAIDGPAGVGKSTVSQMLADSFGYIYINTGAMYRAVAWQAKMNKIEVHHEPSIIAIAKEIPVTFERGKVDQKVSINGMEVTSYLYNEEIGKDASIVSQIKGVRDALTSIQKKMGEQGGVVMEGRDIGTVIFPDADVKFFLSASVEERAKRRYNELKKNNRWITLDAIKKSIMQRDNDDSNRAIAPLKKADDALSIDTTQLSIDEVVQYMIQQVDAKITELNATTGQKN